MMVLSILAKTGIMIALVILLQQIPALQASQASVSGADTPLAQEENKHPIMQRLHQWVSVLDKRSVSVQAIDDFFNTDRINVNLVDSRFNTINELKRWISRRHSLLLSSQHMLSNVDIKLLDANTVLLKFNIAIDEQPVDGPLEQSYIEATWRLQNRQNGLPVIIEISEHYLPPEMHSGSRIQC